MTVDKYILGVLSRTGKESLVEKDVLIQFASDHSISLSRRISKQKVIDAICENGYGDELINSYRDSIRIPIWVVADHYNMSNSMVIDLMVIGAIADHFDWESTWSKTEKKKIEYQSFGYEVLNHNEEDLRKAWEEAFGCRIKFRVECQSDEEFEQVKQGMSVAFDVESYSNSYENRNDDRKRYYFKARPVNNSRVETNRYLAEIHELKARISELESEVEKRVEESYRYFHITKNEYDELRAAANAYQTIKEKQHHAGRKKMFGEDDIAKMHKLRADGMSYNKIAKEFETSKKTIMKYLKLPYDQKDGEEVG